MHCQKCGKKLKPDETFCSICGYYNSEETTNLGSDNWDEIITDNDIEITEDDDSEKWFEDDEMVSTLDDDASNNESEKESFWSKKKKEKEERKAKAAIEKAAKQALAEKQKAEKKAQEEVKAAERKEQKALAEEIKQKELAEKQEREEIERQLKSIKKEENQTKEIEKPPVVSSNEYDEDDSDERLLKAYIGEDYEKIRFKKFNLFAAVFNWAYVLYRKLYITGIFGLLITEIIILKYPNIAIFYAIFVVLLIGFGFNKYYIFISKLNIKNQQRRFEGTDDYSMEKILSRKGGVNVIFTLIIYAIFLAILFYGMFHFTINKTHNTKFWEENTNNEASCLSLTKTSYNYLPNVEIDGQVMESTCRVMLNNNKKEYAIYMKVLYETKIIYVYFQTENSYLQYKGSTRDIAELESRQANGTISDVDKQSLSTLKSIQLTYDDIYEKSKEELKLIKEKKNNSERTDYFFTKEEIVR